jgi:ABC-type amino acid transport substrate-binding protein
MKRITFIILIVLALVGAFFALKKLQIKKDEHTFVVGTAAGYAPWVSVNEHGEYEGFDIDVANALAATMGKTLELKDLGSMASLFVALEQGTIDAIIWGLSITQERLEKVVMIHYQGEPTTSYPLIFWQKIPEGITSINDMKDMTISVEPASAQQSVINRYPFINQRTTERVDDALLNIQYGKTDAAFVEPAIARKFKEKYPEIMMLDVPLGPEDFVQGVGIVIKKDNTKLIEHVRSAVNQLKADGTIAELERKWRV